MKISTKSKKLKNLQTFSQKKYIFFKSFDSFLILFEFHNHYICLIIISFSQILYLFLKTEFCNKKTFFSKIFDNLSFLIF